MEHMTQVFAIFSLNKVLKNNLTFGVFLYRCELACEEISFGKKIVQTRHVKSRLSQDNQTNSLPH